MSESDPYKNLPTGIAAVLRQQQAQAKLLREALGPAYELQKQMESVRALLNPIDDVRRSGLLGEAARLRDAQSEELRKIHQMVGSLTTTRDTFASFDTGIGNIAKALQEKNGVLAAALSATRQYDQLKAFSEQFAPSALAIKEAAERLHALDATGLRTIVRDMQPNAVLAAATQAIEIQRLVDALGQAESVDEGAGLFAAFFTALVGLFSQLSGNTVERLRKLDFIDIIMMFLTVLPLLPSEPPAGLSADEQRQFTEMRQEVETLKEQIDRIMDAQAETVGNWPRGELKRKTNIRSEPRREALQLFRAEQGTVVAVIRRQQRWTLVAYHDPITDRPAQGWLYGNAIEYYDD